MISGVGALYVRRRPRVRVEAPQSGGGQERGMRSGTVPTPLVVGLGAACELSGKEMEVSGKIQNFLAFQALLGMFLMIVYTLHFVYGHTIGEPFCIWVYRFDLR